MEDLVYQTTVVTARRLYKILLRLHISRLKASEADGDVWKPLVQLEEGFRDEAQRSWQEVRDYWASGTKIPAADALFHEILRTAFAQARQDVQAHFELELDPTWVQDRLLEYRR